ncbi:MAG: SufS family cysteine desulfurase [Patescibacteria group bacterium]
MDPLVSRDDFPLLVRAPGEEPLTYLDSAATAQKPAPVLEAMDRFYRKEYASVGRGIYALAEQAAQRYERVREKVASFLGAAHPSEIVFTGNATAAINLVAMGWGRRNLRKGDAVLLTEMEHHANLVPWQMLAKERELELRFAKITEAGMLDRGDFERKLDGARLVALAHASNVLGTINPVTDLANMAHDTGAKVLVDGAQAAARLPVNVNALGADWYVCSAHKLYGPTGIGALWTRRSVYEEMDAVLGGGGAVKQVSFEDASLADPPGRFEPGTRPVVEAVGFEAAVRYMEKIGMEQVAAHERSLNTYVLERLAGIWGLRVLGPADPAARVGLVSFTVEDVHPHDLATLLDQEGIAIRSGHHCAQPLHERLGIPASARASWGVYTDTEDIDRLVDGLKKSLSTLA